MREVKEVLGARIMIKKLENKQETSSGLKIDDDGESLPIARIVLVSKELEAQMDKDNIGRLKAGDIIHYTVARESGRCRHNGEEHFIISIANAVAIL